MVTLTITWNLINLLQHHAVYKHGSNTQCKPYTHSTTIKCDNVIYINFTNFIIIIKTGSFVIYKT